MKKKTIFVVLVVVASFAFGIYINSLFANQFNTNSKKEKKEKMKVGAFSISLSVKDLKISKEFYENIGFEVFAGSMEHKYLIMKNNNALVGLFEGMFEGNILTFNPGWDENAKNLENFDDVREIQKQIKNNGIKLIQEADENSSGPASFMLTDPDGNMILFDQHR